uniref:Uncharacterized protein n=1 Tax=Nonomuraea gerenzanensis TaxID=93944 RepID=A0A1M4EDL2_9ACTN|nr:hypothetical protein [Nonomuraea gerenzanensis]SBO97057.1 hypothetical protein BN4615_P6573 [Nonomuraea gerenzanensis]
MRIRVLAAALGAVLLAGPAAADTPEPAIAPDAAALAGDSGKLCISVPVGAMAKTFSTFVTSFAAEMGAGTAANAASPAGGPAFGAVTLPGAVSPSAGAAPTSAGAAAAPAASPAGGAVSGVAASGPALPESMLVLQATYC